MDARPNHPTTDPHEGVSAAFEGPALAQAIREVARALRAEESAESTLQKMVDLAVATVPGCEHAAVSMTREGRTWTPAASDGTAMTVDEFQYASDQGPCLDALRIHEVAETGDLTQESRWPDFARPASQATGIRSMLSFRLAGRVGVLGALNLYSPRPHAFDADSLVVGGAFADQAALALAGAGEHDRAQRLDHQLTESRREAEALREAAVIALELQRSMLTELPEIDDLELQAIYRPAATGHQVGGDWYDAFTLADGATALVVGDISGHDLAAAACMGAIRNLLRGIAWDRVGPPSGIVERLDSAIHGLRLDAITSLVHARIERDGVGQAHLRWTNAGHPPPMLLVPDGTVITLNTSPELLLGVAEDVRRTDQTVPLTAGSTCTG